MIIGGRIHKTNCQCRVCKNVRGEVHKSDCQCLPCKNRRGELHKENCQCMVCKAQRGEYKGKTLEEMGHDTEICQCMACRMVRKEFEGENNPAKQSEVRKKMRETQSCPEMVEEKRKRILGNKNPMKRPEVVAKITGKNSPTKRSEVRTKISITMSKLIAEGKINPADYHGKGGYFYSEKNKKELQYRSSYELQAYKILEQLSKVVKYESEPFYIPYRFQGIERNYVPDILIIYDDNSQELIEVMREDLLEDEIRIVKLKAAKRYCDKNNIKFSVWTENFLFSGSK